MGKTIRRAVLFVAGLVPLASNTLTPFLAGRDVHVFPTWVVAAGVGLSLIIANISDDQIGASAAKLSQSLSGWLVWRNKS